MPRSPAGRARRFHFIAAVQLAALSAIIPGKRKIWLLAAKRKLPGSRTA